MPDFDCNVPSVTLVGAGPGDPDLITLKGMRALQQARVVLYDALVSPELLGFAKADCKKVFVGKRRGKKEFSQEEINQLLVFYATRYGHVVRLKGGDPFVFGRGHEEVEYVHRRGIAVEIVPGISSALAAPAAAGIPVTKRGTNESFWVVTGTLASGEISADLELAAQSSATIIVLMGMANLKEIASLVSHYRSPQEPVAIIQYATCPAERIVRGDTATIEAQVEAGKISSPAVIVIGKVVDESHLVDYVKVSVEHRR